MSTATDFEILSVPEKRFVLERRHCPVHVSAGVRRALQQADIIVYAAGTQHSSLYPTYMSTGLARTISYNRNALKVFITNIGADYETPDYRASDYVRGAYRYLNSAEPSDIPMPDLIDVILINQSLLKPSETYVVYDEEGFADLPVRRVVGAFESHACRGKHDGARLVDQILALYEQASTNAKEKNTHFAGKSALIFDLDGTIAEPAPLSARVPEVDVGHRRASA